MKVDIKYKCIFINNDSLTLEELITQLKESGLKDYFNYKVKPEGTYPTTSGTTKLNFNTTSCDSGMYQVKS
jgi:hypothetical protein